MNLKHLSPAVPFATLYSMLIASLICAVLLVGTPTSGDTPVTAIVFLSGDNEIAEGTLFSTDSVISTTNGLNLSLPDGSEVELGEKTTVCLAALSDAARRLPTSIELRRGSVRAVVPKRTTGGNAVFQVVTPVAVAGVRGTDFAVGYEPGTQATASTQQSGAADVDVFDGTVGVWQFGGDEEPITAGNGATLRRQARFVQGRRQFVTQIERRAVAQKTRDRWEARRQALLDRLKRRHNITDEESAGLRDYLKNLPPEQREAIKAKVIERLRQRAAQQQQQRANQQPRVNQPRRNTPPRRTR